MSVLSGYVINIVVRILIIMTGPQSHFPTHMGNFLQELQRDCSCHRSSRSHTIATLQLHFLDTCNLCVTPFTLESLTLHHIHLFKLQFSPAMRDQAQHHDRMSPRNQEVFDYLMKNQYDNTFPKHEHQQPQIIETTIPKHINQNAFDKSRMHDAASIATGASTRTGKTAITSATSSSHHKEDEHGPLQDLVLQSLSESLSVEHPPSEAMNPMINETRTLPKNTDVNNSCASDSAAGHPYPQEDMDRTLLDQSQVQPSVPSMLHKLGGFFKNPISCGDEVVSPLKNTDANGNVKSNSNKSSSSKRTPKSADESQERIAILEASLAQKTREIEKLLKLQELVVTEVSLM